MSGNSNTIIDNVVLTPGGVFDVDRLPPTVDIPAGEQGVGIQSVVASGPDGDGVVTLTITYTNNSSATTTFTPPAGPPGMAGGSGAPGTPGVSVTGITLESLPDGEYRFRIDFSDGSQVQTVPFDTAKGDMGDPGLSAYQVALADGFVGTQAEWIASLEGDPGTPAPVINEVTVTETSGNYELTLGFNEGADVTSDPFTLAVNESLGSLTDVSLTTPIAGQGLTYNGSEWINAQSSHITLHDNIPAGNQQQLQSLVETTYLADGSQTSVVWVFDAIMPVTPGDPTSSFSALPTQYGFDDGDTITLTLTADSSTNSYFSVSDGGEVTTVISVSGVGANDSVWSGTVTSAQPSLGDTDVTELVVTLTSQTGGNQISGNFTVNMEVVVDNPTTHPANVLTRGYSFTIAEAADTTMAATYSATTFTFDGDDHNAQPGTATLTVSNGTFDGVPPTISASAGNLTLGTVTVNAADNVATVPFSIAEPAAETTVSSTLTWDATARPVGATGTNGETSVISNGVQVITTHGEPAPSPMVSGSPPGDVSESAFTIPTSTVWGINSSSDLGAGEYYYALEDSSGLYTHRELLTGTTSSDTSIQIPGTIVFPSPLDGYEQRGVQVGFRSTTPDPDVFTVVENFEGVQFESYHPILLWYNQAVTAAADIEALYPAVDMVATEVITPSTADIITGHTFTPTSGNFVMLLIPDTWQTVTSVSIVGDGNDQPVGVTVLPAGQITGITDSFGTSVLYQGFYVAGASPNVRLRIDSLS